MIDLHIAVNNTITNSSFGLEMAGSDLRTDTGLRAAVIYSLFTDRRAGPDEALPGDSTDRRGCWHETYKDADLDPSGSWLWLLEGAKETQETLLRAETYAREALQWFINRGIALSVTVTGRWVRAGTLGLVLEMPLVDGGRYADEFPYLLGVAA